MRAAYVTANEKVELKEIARPIIADDEVLIEVRTAGICGSDLHLFAGTHAFRKPPAILGHEAAGEVIEIGKNVSSVQIGDRVTVEPHVGCGVCDFCKKDLVNICDHKRAPGTPDWIGTFVEYFPAPEKAIYKLKDTVSYEMGTMIEPLAVAVHALRRIRIPEKDCLVILGAGTIGLLALVAAKELGYQKIICTDTALFNREMALLHGAACALDPLREDVAAKVKEMTGSKGADVALIAAGAPNIMDQASACVKKRGEVGLVAMITKAIPVYTYSFVFNEQTLFGCMTYETKDFKEAADMINNGLDLTKFITQVVDLDHAQQGLRILSEKKESVVKVLVKVK